MKFTLCCLAALCIWKGSATASPFPIYSSASDGSTVAPAVGASAYGAYLSTGWIFGEVSVDPSWVGQAIWGQDILFTAPAEIQVGVLEGLWAADGPDGGPGTLLDIGETYTLDFLPTDSYIIVYTNYPVPAGNFWVGYSFETYDQPSATAAQLNALAFDLGSAPTVGTTSTDALLSSATGVLGNDPAISGTAGGYLAQGIYLYSTDAPETSTWALITGGILSLVGLKFRSRKAGRTQDLTR